MLHCPNTHPYEYDNYMSCCRIRVQSADNTKAVLKKYFWYQSNVIHISHSSWTLMIPRTNALRLTDSPAQVQRENAGTTVLFVLVAFLFIKT